KVRARRWFVQASKNIHERGFARAGGSHDGDKVSALDIEGDAFQHMHQHLSDSVVLDQIPHLDDDVHGCCGLETWSSTSSGLSAETTSRRRCRLRHRCDNDSVALLHISTGNLG